MTPFFRISLVSLTASLGCQHASAQLLRPRYVIPDFSTSQPEYNNWEYSRWDMFYTPHDQKGTLSQNRNYPDKAAPNGYKVYKVGSDEIGPVGDVAKIGDKYVYVGAFNGEYVWDTQSHAEAVASGFTGPMPTNPNPTLPRTIFHLDNPSIRQHASSAFIIGPGYTGNIYSFAELVSYTLDDSLAYNAGTVVFQFQNQGRDVDMDTLRLRYVKNGNTTEIPATDLIIEREAFASHAGFTFTTRAAAEWDVSSLGIRSYQIVWKAAGSSCSVQECLLDTADAYVRDKGLPAKRIFLGTNGASWNQASNWRDVAGGTSPPKNGANIELRGGTSLDLGSTTRKVGLLKTQLPGDFTLQGTTPLELGTGLQSATSATPKTIAFNVPVRMTAFNYFDVGANVTVSLNQPFTSAPPATGFTGATGFEKRGDGNLKLAADNSFAGALFVSGGQLTISGKSFYGAPGPTELDVTYIYLGELVLESTGTLGVSGVRVELGSTPYEIPGETRPSRLVVKGERVFDRPINFTGGSNPKLLTFTGTGAGSTCSSAITLHDGTELGIFGTETPTGDFSLETPLATDKVRFTGAFTGGDTINHAPTPHSLRKTGAGTVTFAGTNKAYKHRTSVEEGRLVSEAGTGITGGNWISVSQGATFTANGPLTLTGGNLTVNGLLDGSGALTRSGSVVVSGGGHIAKPLTIDASSALAPGNGLGSITMTGNQTWGPDGHLRFEIGGEGVSDSVNISGALALTATAANRFFIDLQSLTLSGAAGPVHDFNGYGDFSWRICTASGGITGFDPAAFSVNTAGFTNSLAGNFSVALRGQDLVLVYTATSSPNPSFTTWAASLPAGSQGPADDADHDGVSNLVEFSLGTSGTAVNADGSPLRIRRETTEGIGHSVLEFSVAEPFRPGVVAQLLQSPSMDSGSWRTVASKSGPAAWQSLGILTEATPAGGRRKLTVRVPDAAGEPPQRFFQLRFRNGK
ncbi:autotransporter-associated beta strand repeat-containing protein [Luteolibacter yonseiensis]|uniref:Autotransporter-associated beta strand repeat-containing protein n=1 Tax=Luteolibacter yonseiensis TaxID=1144680 RepID=A0A934R444_9BACT|nr:autotransporter-associated beta strand repeat-containing protein [Luteolibacter yonseiensis]MBK1815698.1 autotransporter-associated beta strand repeat-containing protein [Luteolibacter yonseiensis]